jgi:hypothetical protein
MKNENDEKFALEIQLDNICRILGGEAKYYFCSSKNTTHRKLVIEYEHSSNLQ